MCYNLFIHTWDTMITITAVSNCEYQKHSGRDCVFRLLQLVLNQPDFLRYCKPDAKGILPK